MTVGQLRAELRNFDQNMQVVVSGVEDGYDDVHVGSLQTIKVLWRDNAKTDGEKSEWRNGIHSSAADGDPAAVEVVLI